MFDHICDAIAPPQLTTETENVPCPRWETMKPYSAVTAVKHLLNTVHVSKSDTLINSSSSIHALAQAMACHKHSMNCHLVGSTTIDRTRCPQRELRGATVEQVPPRQTVKLAQNLRGERIHEIVDNDSSSHWRQQYHHQVHNLGYQAVAELLAQKIPTDQLTLVGEVSTGVSTGAILSYLWAQGRDLHFVATHLFSRGTFDAAHVSGPGTIIAETGSSIEPRNVRNKAYDRLHWIAYTQASSGSLHLMRDTGIVAGHSGGTAYLTPKWERRRQPHRHDPRTTLVTLPTDTPLMRAQPRDRAVTAPLSATPATRSPS